MTTLITAGLPVYNGEAHLDQALRALRAQTYPALEIVISDNASTDRTEEICRAAAAEDPRVRYYRQPVNLGATANFRRVFELARGEFFFWAGHHDLWEPTFAAACGAALEAHPDAVLGYPEMRYIDVDGGLIGHHRDATIDTVGLGVAQRMARLIERYPVCAVYGLFRTEALRAITTEHGIGLHRPQDHMYSDVVLLMQLARLGGYALVPETLYFNRVMPKQKVTSSEYLDQLLPSKVAQGRWSRVHLFRDLIEVIGQARLGLAEHLWLLGKLARHWGWDYTRTYLYQLDTLGILSRTKRLARSVLGGS